MNWYKTAQLSQNLVEVQQIHNLQDRNRLNAKIHHLDKIRSILVYAAKLVHQTQRGARLVLQDVIADKRMSSYPKVKNVLNEANKVAMDSPNKFAKICKQGIFEVEDRIVALKVERKRYMDDEMGKSRKGLLM